MKNMQRKAIIIILLLIAVGYAGYVYFPRGKKTTPTAVTMTMASTTTLAQPATKEAAAEAKAAKAPTPEAALSDPFAVRVPVKGLAKETPAEAPSPGQPETSGEAVKIPEPVLEGIWIGPESKVVFISGQSLTEGGGVLGWRVTSISKNRVVLVKGGRTKILKLGGI